MAWSASGVFQEWVKNPSTQRINPGSITLPTGYSDLVATDTVKVALYDNDITPDKDAAVGSTGYNTGAWAIAGNEVTDATNWVAGGRALSGKAYTDVANGMMFDATDLAGGGTLTLAATHGCLVYDDSITAGTVADQGVCFNYFGGAQQVTNGTFTIVWHANGIFRFTV